MLSYTTALELVKREKLFFNERQFHRNGKTKKEKKLL